LPADEGKQDKRVSPAITKQNDERPGGPKQYVEIAYGHRATDAAFINEYVCIVAGYLQQVEERTA
jgi:hypothetical protein